MSEIKSHPLPSTATTVDAVILADGDYPAEGTIAHSILSNADYVVCCDGATDKFTSKGGVPAAIVGDCDSISKVTLERFSDIIHKYNDQESNDLTKAFRYCITNGKASVIILGATGRREDHTIANISLLADYAELADVSIVTNNGVFNSISRPAIFESREGQQVSIFTIDTTTPITTSGLKYIPPANGLCSWWRGSLNESVANEFKIYTSQKTLIFRAF